MVLHFFYWGTNQFIVQRALARSDKEARIGIITAGFFKLLIPFFSIGTGIAAFYLFEKNNMIVASDGVFITLLTEYAKPIGYGVLGLVAAGLIGAILSTVDSMLNSAATIITFGVYKKCGTPTQMTGNSYGWAEYGSQSSSWSPALFRLPSWTPIPKSFFHRSRQSSNLVSGLVVAFLVGMFWKRA